MINKKAEDFKIGPLIKLILIVLVIVIVFWGVFSFDMYKFFKNLPDFFKTGSRPDELFVDAVVYGINVKVLLNDGESRCVVAEVPISQDQNNDWLKAYGVKKGNLEINKKPVETMQWVSEDMINVPQDFIDKEKEIISEIKKVLDEGKFTREANLVINPFIGDITSPEFGRAEDSPGFLKLWSESSKQFLSLPAFVQEYINKKAWNLRIICDEKPVRRIINGCLLQNTEIETQVFGGGKIYVWQDFNVPLGYNGIWTPLEETIIKNQIIKKDLMKACYSETDDFKETVILGKSVTLLLNDKYFAGDGKCVIYDSKDDSSLEHYSIKYEILGTLLKRAILYELDGNGNWEDIESRLPSPEEIELRDKMNELNLIEKEKQFANYLGGFTFKICLDKNGDNCPDQSQYSSYLREVQIVFQAIKSGNTEGLDSLFKRSDNLRKDGYFLLFSNIETQKQEIRQLLWQYIQDNNLNVDTCTILENNCIIKKDGYSVNGGILYKWEKPVYKELDKTNYDYLYLPIDDWSKLLKERSIKLDLINECKK